MLLEFRTPTVLRLGAGRQESLPRVAMAKQELERLLKQHMQQDAQVALRRLADLGSAPVQLAIRLSLTRPLARKASWLLKGNRPAHPNLPDAPGATRYKYFHGESPLAVHCPQCWNAVDSFGHMPQCSSVPAGGWTGPDTAAFLVVLAGRVKTSPPGLFLLPCLQILRRNLPLLKKTA